MAALYLSEAAIANATVLLSKQGTMLFLGTGRRTPERRADDDERGLVWTAMNAAWNDGGFEQVAM